MKKRIYIYLFVLISVTNLHAQKSTDVYYEISKSIDLFGRVYKEIALKYVEEINPREFMLSGIKGMLETLDPYTVYIDESSQKDIDLITTGKYGGIGATIGLRNEKITVVDLIEGYSAQRQGLRIGDEIIKIDSVEVNKDNYDQLSHYMKGEAGTMVSLTVKREGIEQNLIFNLIREEIEIKNLTYFGFVPEESNNVYLKLSGFSRSAGEEIKDALLELRNERAIESIILDLRGNPGGLLDAAISVADKFLPKGDLIVSVVGRDSSDIQNYYADEEPVAGDANLIVLVDEGSASASEIVAGAIQDHDRGVVLGTESFGKGLVQNVIPLDSRTSLKITTGKYFTPSGRSIQKINYVDNNVIIGDTTFNRIEEYRTDSNRKVYSGGGIQPDTLVENNSKSELIRTLIAQGVFFKFATNFFNTNSIASWEEINKEELFESFKKYFSESDTEFVFKSERLLKALKEALSDEKISDDVKIKLNELEQVIEQAKQEELNIYRDDVIAELHKEIAARVDGMVGRITASMNYDKQLKTALSILESSEKYNKILAVAE